MWFSLLMHFGRSRLLNLCSHHILLLQVNSLKARIAEFEQKHQSKMSIGGENCELSLFCQSQDYIIWGAFFWKAKVNSVMSLQKKRMGQRNPLSESYLLITTPQRRAILLTLNTLSLLSRLRKSLIIFWPIFCSIVPTKLFACWYIFLVFWALFGCYFFFWCLVSYGCLFVPLGWHILCCWVTSWCLSCPSKCPHRNW